MHEEIKLKYLGIHTHCVPESTLLLAISSQEVQLEAEPEHVLHVELQGIQVPPISVCVEGHTQRPPGPLFCFKGSIQSVQAILDIQVLQEESQGKQEEPDE